MLRETSLWNLQIQQARECEENDETVGDDGDYNDDIAQENEEVNQYNEMSVSTA